MAELLHHMGHQTGMPTEIELVCPLHGPAASSRSIIRAKIHRWHGQGGSGVPVEAMGDMAQQFTSINLCIPGPIPAHATERLLQISVGLLPLAVFRRRGRELGYNCRSRGKIEGGAEERSGGTMVRCKSENDGKIIRKFWKLDDAGKRMLVLVTDRLGLSERSCTRSLKLARTIADLEGRKGIKKAADLRSIQDRSLDTKTG